MGNQPSAPAPPAPPPPPPAPPAPPPLPPPCDIACQKQKNLDLLKKTLDETDKETDPEGYEKARIAYNTLLYGQGWLQGEKQRIGREEVLPVIDNYKTTYESLKADKKSQSMFVNLSNILTGQEQADSADNQFLQKQLMKEKDHADVLNRMSELNAGTPEAPPQISGAYTYIPIVIDIVIVILAICVLYFGFTKFLTPKSVSIIPPSVSGATT
jgi:type IV secretory pathway VirB10-like protein